MTIAILTLLISRRVRRVDGLLVKKFCRLLFELFYPSCSPRVFTNESSDDDSSVSSSVEVDDDAYVLVIII